MNIKPLFDKVVLKQPEKAEATKSGIILSASAQEKPEFLEVCAVGEGIIVDGIKQPMLVKIGDKVLVAKFAGTQIELEKKEYTVVSQQDILAIIE